MFVSLFLGIPLLFIVIIAFTVMAAKRESEKGGEDVIKNVYFYLVLFVTLMMTIGGSVGVFMAVADIVSPAPYYQSFEDYKYSGRFDKPAVDKEVTEKDQLSEEELQERYTTMVTAEKERQINRAKNTLIKSFGWIIIPFPIFLYCQRRLFKKEE